MIKKIILSALSLACVCSHANCEVGRNFLLQNAAPKHIFINNRILARVNGKPISVIDVMKKLDMLFYRQFPQYSSSVEARFQFYQINWKRTLNQLVEKEMILADAEDVKMEVSHGDIRQEIENLFGPNIIVNLEKAGLSFEEAWELVKEEQTLRRMLSMRVNALAVRSITPQDVKTAYHEYAKANIKPDEWCYHTISVRGDDEEACREVVNDIYQLAVHDQVGLEKLGEHLEEHSLVAEGAAKYNLSEETVRTDKEISESYRNVLKSLDVGTFSKPVSQDSRNGQSQVFRIFYLKDKISGGEPLFSDVEMKLRNQLIDDAIDKESEKYIAKLKKRFRVHTDLSGNMYPENYHPFELR